MKVTINRLDFTDVSTIGEMLWDGKFQCITLEDTCREHKIKGVTAIPAGEYEVIVTYSTRFKRDLPLLVGVPDFDGIRIHNGNTDKNTDGCILVGKTKQTNWIGSSIDALNELFPKIVETLKTEKITIAVIGGRKMYQ